MSKKPKLTGTSVQVGLLSDDWRRAELEAKLAKAVEALERIEDDCAAFGLIAMIVLVAMLAQIVPLLEQIKELN